MQLQLNTEHLALIKIIAVSLNFEIENKKNQKLNKTNPKINWKLSFGTARVYVNCAVHTEKFIVLQNSRCYSHLKLLRNLYILYSSAAGGIRYAEKTRNFCIFQTEIAF